MIFDEDFNFNGEDVPRIYDRTPLRIDFRSIDFNKQIIGDSLFPVYDDTFGIRNKVDWLGTPGGSMFVLEANVYTFEIPGLVQSLPMTRTKTFTWFNRDGTENPLTKVVTKVYDRPQALVAAARRRELLIRNLEAEIFGEFGAAILASGVTDPIIAGALTSGAARTLRSHLEPGVNEYLISGLTQPLIDLFGTSTEPLLDTITGSTTLRDQSIARVI